MEVIAAILANALMSAAPGLIKDVADLFVKHPEADDAAKRAVSDALQAEGHSVLDELRAKDKLGTGAESDVSGG